MVPAPPPAPFVGLPIVDGRYVINDTPSVQYLIQNLQWLTRKRFKLHDHQFSLGASLKSHPPDGGPSYGPHSKEEAKPLLADCLAGIEQSIANVLIRLRAYYNLRNAHTQERERCYVFILHKELNTSIIVGNFNLHQENLERIARICTTRLFEFLNSGTYVHLGLRLDDSLQVRFVTIGEKHIKSKKLKGVYNPQTYTDEDIVGGSKVVVRMCPYNWLTLAPVGTYNNKTAFKDQCLLVCVILGNLINTSREAGATKKEQSDINIFLRRPGEAMTDKLAGLLTYTLTELTFKLKIEMPIKMGLCKKLAKFYKSQIIIYNEESPPKIVAMYPPKANLSLKPIYLLLSKLEEDKFHVDLIKDIKMFYSTRGYACTGCKFTTRFFWWNFRHLCRAKLTECCFACHRILMRTDTYVNKGIESLFCDSKLKNNFPKEECKGCGVIFFSESCRLAHDPSFCLKKGFTCPKCVKFVPKVRTQDNVTAHVCSANRTCKFCRKDVTNGEMHQCSWDLPRASNQLDNLAFINFSYSTNSAQCSHCLDNSLSSCEMHPFGTPREIKPIMVNLLYENERHGDFDQIDMYDPVFKKMPIYRKQTLSFDYLVTGLESKLFKERHPFKLKQPRRKEPQLELAVQLLQKKEEKTVAEALLATILCQEYQNFTFVTTESKAINCLVRAMVENGITPKNTLLKGAETILMRVPVYGIRFICLTQFLQGSCSDLKRQFNLDFEEAFHPKQMILSEENATEILPAAPSFDCYAEIMDTEDIRQKKLLFWKKISNSPFCYGASLERLAKQELLVKSTAALHFLKTSLELQEKCYFLFGKPEHYREDSLAVIPAFKFISLPSFLKCTFRTFALKPDTLYAVNNQYGTRIAGSKLELEATEYLRLKEPGQWITQYSNPGGQKQFFLPGQKQAFTIADAYNPITKTVFYINGCYWHGHPDCRYGCKEGQDKVAQQKKYAKFCSQMELLLTECSKEVSTVKVLWECQFTALKAGSGDDGSVLPKPFQELKQCNKQLVDFLKSSQLRPFQKMVIRDALSTALCEAYALKYVKEPSDADTCYILDVASLYPHIGIEWALPQGRYSTLIGDDLKASKITVDTENLRMFLDDSEVIAIVHCRVYPPKTLKHPFLQTKVNEKIVLTLCRACSKAAANKNEDVIGCQHSQEQRSFVSTLSSYECAYASGLGYQFYFFEMIIYREASFFLRPFLTLLGFEKLKHSEYPKNIDNPEKRSDYCKQLNEKMRFMELIGKELTADTVEPNPELRSFFKASLNVFLGTFGANAEKGSTVKYLERYAELVHHMKNDNLVNIQPLSDSILQVTIKNKELFPSRTSNVSVAICITSLARCVVHKQMMQVTGAGGTLLRVSCDELCFLLPPSVALPFQISEAFGEFKHKYEGITAVVQVGLRNVSIVTQSNGHTTEHLITSGIMQSLHNCKKLSNSIYKRFVDNLFSADNVKSPIIRNVKVYNSAKKRKLEVIASNQIAFNQHIYARRQFFPNSKLCDSLPYGYVIQENHVEENNPVRCSK